MNYDKLCERVYEHFTGKCWHRWAKTTKGGHLGYIHECSCGHKINSNNENPPQLPCRTNPDLAHSLDAWRPIWDAMEKKLGDICINYDTELRHVRLKGEKVPAIWNCTPLHHLEAAARAARVKCKRCDGTGEEKHRISDGYSLDNGEYPTESVKPIDFVTPCTCDNGETTIWEEEK